MTRGPMKLGPKAARYVRIKGGERRDRLAAKLFADRIARELGVRRVASEIDGPADPGRGEAADE